MAEDFDWDDDAAINAGIADVMAAEVAEATKETETAALKKRQAREEWERQQRWAAEDWFDDEPVARNKLKRDILKHLNSAEGRDGPLVKQLANILDYDASKVAVCIASLRKSRGVMETEDGELYHYKVWRTLHPERRGVVKHIGTVPQAVLEHKASTPARRSVATALNGHFYRTRRARTKQKAVSVRELAKAAGVAEKTVRLTIQWLDDEGLLMVAARGQGRRGHLYRWTAKTKDYKPRLRTRSSVVSGLTSNP